MDIRLHSLLNINDYTGIGLEVRVKRSFDYLSVGTNEWDELVSNSTSNSIFQTSSWLRACIDTYCDATNLLVTEVRANNKLIAAAAFRERDGAIEFAGRERSDYCDLVLSRDLDEGDAIKAAEALLIAARDASTKFRHFLLARIPIENQTVRLLQSPRCRLFAQVRRYAVAPSMEMTVASEKLHKKSLQRHEKGLQRTGKLESHTFTRASDIFPKLDEFFTQHIERWDTTPTPSIFLQTKHREFYRRMIENLDPTGWLRFTVLLLDGKMIAAHLGWFYLGRFYWYKPTYDIRLKTKSPGEVLLKRVIEQAVADKAEEFDFLIGDETYKSRFATKTRKLVWLEIDDSWLSATSKRIKRAVYRRLHIQRRKQSAR
jgi:CelD/BcsL family acetyltransferase involved in cellulose biosynthesis